MRILYAANHKPVGNCDEDAITYSLRQLGHIVFPIHEHREMKIINIARKAHLVLFHHWKSLEALDHIKASKAFWYFDLVDFPGDSTLIPRNKRRRDWMARAIPRVDIGFCTDGDWAAQDNSGKLVRILQGADERISKVQSPSQNKDIPILFAGTSRGGGRGRISFVKEMQQHYGSGFVTTYRNHRESLRELISRASIVVAPDSPITDNYWSNRVYITCGFRGFLLHPYAASLADHYEDGKELVFYHSRGQLHSLIEHYLKDDAAREEIAQAGWQRTLREHTYTDRCKQLINLVRERCNVYDIR